MTKDLKQRIKERWETFTASEKKIATYLLHNIGDLPFETTASLSKRSGVSPMTVWRFLRTLDYKGVGDLKEELRGDSNWRQLYKQPDQSNDADAIAARLQAETRALADVHALAQTAEWKSVVGLLVSADRVSVASFQHSAFLGLGLAKMLQQVRPRVSFNSGADGAYVDMLLDSTSNSCVVLVDTRRYFKQFRTLAKKVAERGIPLVLITDTECYWARELTPHVLMTQPSWVWHNYTSLACLFSLLTAAVIQESSEVMTRLSDVNELRESLVEYTGPAPGKARKRSVTGKQRQPSPGHKTKAPDRSKTD
ncbi:MAG TPA: MurR/RpiR family transcriptional regulator [Rhodanobacter sp.]|nr:MurR/RpiR family transcriptional regulator [Rhodanobacter sp.]